MKMPGKFYSTAAYFVICLAWYSLADKNTKANQSTLEKHQGNEVSKLTVADELASSTNLFGDRLCVNCNQNQLLSKETQIENSNFSVKTSLHHSPSENIGQSKISPEESGNGAVSRKYSPQVGSQHDGFVPIPRPFGMKPRLGVVHSSKPKHRLGVHSSKPKPRLGVVHSSKPTISSSSRIRPFPRHINSELKHNRGKNHMPQNVQSVKARQSMRRSRYHQPKAEEDLTVKESITNENILGNGNFEILRGGIFSDQDTNEIIGSRRMGRGYGTFVMPVHQQSRFNPVRNIAFPPVYQQLIQNPFNPEFYPRAPY